MVIKIVIPQLTYALQEVCWCCYLLKGLLHCSLHVYLLPPHGASQEKEEDCEYEAKCTFHFTHFQSVIGVICCDAPEAKLGMVDNRGTSMLVNMVAQ